MWCRVPLCFIPVGAQIDELKNPSPLTRWHSLSQRPFFCFPCRKHLKRIVCVRRVQSFLSLCYHGLFLHDCHGNRSHAGLGGGGGSSGRWHRSSRHFVLKALSWTQDASCLTCSHCRPPLCSVSHWFLLMSLVSKMAGVSLPSAFRHPLGDLCQRWGCKYRVCVDHAYAPVSGCLVLSPFGCLRCNYLRVSKTEFLNFSTSLFLALQRPTNSCCSVFQC